MEQIAQMQKEYEFFSDMLKTLETIQKHTPGNGFAKMKCLEKLELLEAAFDRIDYATQVTYD